ncbi:hypothetical protein [Rubellicoccus peritrichatus]|uniref:Uncharacterized protein n=1 Tax=Rubellicoccus peritrichatus TaxID=3080537 RepID=A0AAQ3LAE2_9BACT|nr:hypothetical protein [Puniceicoccus sp. CR14]WOO40315.1 hypothetical protein RZN69_16980 [Puniceicoccus sp. CR14]
MKYLASLRLVWVTSILCGYSFILQAEIENLNKAFEGASPSLDDAQWKMSGKWSIEHDSSELLQAQDFVVGEEGIAFYRKPVEDFVWIIGMRYDKLRFSRYLPKSGIAFGAFDRKNMRRVTLDRLTGQLRLTELDNNRVDELAISKEGFPTSPGEWFLLKVEKNGSRLQAWLSNDAIQWEPRLSVDLPDGAPGSKIGIVAGTPKTWFNLAPPIDVEDTIDRRDLTSLRYTANTMQTSPNQFDAEFSIRISTDIRETVDPKCIIYTDYGRQEILLDAARLNAGSQNVWLTFPSEPDLLALKIVPIDNEGNGESIELSFLNPIKQSDIPRVEIPADLDQPITKSRLLEAIEQAKVYHARQNTRDYRSSDWSLLNVWMYEVTSSPTYIDLLINRARILLSEYDRDDSLPVTFHDFYPMSRTIETALVSPELSDEEKSKLKEIIEKTLSHAAYERGPMNRSLGVALGTFPALRIAPDVPQAVSINSIRDLVWSDYRHLDPLEDSTNYSMLTLFFSLLIIEESQQYGLLSDPRLVRIFERLYFSLSPLGFIPAYGDDEDSHPGLLTGLFQMAFDVTGDSKYQWAANRVFNMHFYKGYNPMSMKAIDILGLAYALRSMKEDNPGLPSVPDGRGVELLSSNRGYPLKLSYRSGNAPDDLFVLIDLLNGTEHGHNDASAVVSITQNQKLIEDNGRYSRAHRLHNLMVLEPQDTASGLRDTAEQSRRMQTRQFKPGKWMHYRFALPKHWIWGNFAGEIGLPSLDRAQYHPDVPFSYNTEREFVLGWEWKGEGSSEQSATVYLDDIKLLSSMDDKSPQVLVDFENTSSIPDALNGELDVLPDDERGGSIGRFDFSLGTETTYVGLRFPQSLCIDDENELFLDFYMKVEETGGDVFLNSTLIGDQDGYPKRYLEINNPAVTSEVVDQQAFNGGSYVRVENRLTDREGRNQVTVREFIFVEQQGIWIRDTLLTNMPKETQATVYWHLQNSRLVDKDKVVLPGGSHLYLRSEEGRSAVFSQHAVYGMRNSQVFQLSSNNPKPVIDTLLTLPQAASAKWETLPSGDSRLAWGKYVFQLKHASEPGFEIAHN